MTNALTAADSVLIPICPEFYSTEGLSDLISSVLKNRRRLNPSIQFEGIVLSRCNLRTNLYRTTRTNVENAFRGGDSGIQNGNSRNCKSWGRYQPGADCDGICPGF